MFALISTVKKSTQGSSTDVATNRPFVLCSGSKHNKPMAVCSVRCCFCCLLSLSVMINPHNDSAFYAYADWALAQEIAWDEEQEELEELETLEDYEQ